jgi:hypothetical protein
MDHEKLQIAYIERINALLPTVDFARLDKSCNSNDGEYAKEILKQMHDLLVEVYRTDNLDSDYEFVQLPAVIRGRNTSHIGLGLISLDLQSSGEHWGTFFLTPRGVIDQGFEKMKPADSKYLSAVYIPYDYWYTVSIERDHHVDFDHIPEKVAELLNSCYPDQPEQGQHGDIPGQGVEMG